MSTLFNILSKIKKRLIKFKDHANFDHIKAQTYEMDYASKWLDDNFERVFREISNKKKQKKVISDEFFKNKYLWNKFIKYIENKTCLEIGSGPAGALIRWYWTKRRIIIDPLVSEYKRLSIEKFGKSFFTDDIILYSQNAETYIPNLRNKINGVIVCRNALDHCENPIKVIENMAKYAKSGCYLLLWSDIYHKKGHDEGHTNITRSKAKFENLIKKSNFEIQYKFSLSKRDTINYGCVAIKRIPK